jgi:hypothetical protein
MNRVIIACALLAQLQVAQARDYLVTYRSVKLTPTQGDQGGVKGVKRITATWKVANIPNPGRCELFGKETFKSYSDGKRTLESLKTNYRFDPNEEPQLLLCVNKYSQIRQDTMFDFNMVTNKQGVNYKAYEALAYPGVGKRIAIVSVTTYENSKPVAVLSDSGHGGEFTLSK